MDIKSAHHAHDLEMLRQGCSQALRRLFDQYYPGLVSAVFAYVSDVDTSKDIAQEVFAELWQRRQSLIIDPARLGAYLHRAAINRALNHLKVRQRYQLQEDDASWHDLPDPSVHDIDWKAQQDELEERLQEAIEQLPEKCRIIFQLSRFERLPHREIAQRLGISVKTIENQLLRAMRLLRLALEKYRYLSSIVLLCIKGWWGQ
ncbi:MAG: RNA polymerase sigma-70 factor [Saprospiraceae bacterium]|nr:RNA polymerase sigma-70 factor [Saprospiraceae bacterium]MDW8228897.1 RNA polymerase sigma-70 factor [Saprospiraceae bacterium]